MSFTIADKEHAIFLVSMPMLASAPPVYWTGPNAEVQILDSDSSPEFAAGLAQWLLDDAWAAYKFSTDNDAEIPPEARKDYRPEAEDFMPVQGEFNPLVTLKSAVAFENLACSHPWFWFSNTKAYLESLKYACLQCLDPISVAG